MSLNEFKQIKSQSERNEILQTKAFIKELKKVIGNRQDKIDAGTDSEDENDEDNIYSLQDFDAGAKNQDENKHVFRNNYGIELPLPSFYVQDAKIYPGEKNFIFKIVKYVLPNDDEYRMDEFRENPETKEIIKTEKKISESYSGEKYDEKHCVL